MKKRILLMVLAVLCVLTLAACQCDHDWEKATCEDPKICEKCGEEKGKPLGHDWLDATCEDPKTCENCGETKGKALGHDWLDATCEDPKTCENCGETKGEALGHEWLDATYDDPQTCENCGETQGEPLEKPAASGSATSYTAFAEVMNMVMADKGYALEFALINDDGEPIYRVCDASTGTYLEVGLLFYVGSDGETVTGSLVFTEKLTDDDAVYLTGYVSGISWALLNPNMDSDSVNQMLAGTPKEGDDGSISYYMTKDGYDYYMIATETMIIFATEKA